MAVSGTFDSAVVTAQYQKTVDTFTNFATTAITLSAAGEKLGRNYGAYNEININVASAGASAALVVIVNLVPLDGQVA